MGWLIVRQDPQEDLMSLDLQLEQEPDEMR
jgi:hypothetical protein